LGFFKNQICDVAHAAIIQKIKPNLATSKIGWLNESLQAFTNLSIFWLNTGY
jgi:hypothetical protein